MTGTTRIIGLFVFSFWTSFLLRGQETTAIGEWESLLPYQTGKWVTQSDDRIYYATDLSLLILDKNDLSPSFVSKVDGLSDTGIDLIKYDHFNDQLIIVYNNSNIDIIKDGVILNESSIRDNSNIIGSRKINDIHIADQERIFFSTAFGILEYRSSGLEFGSTVFTNTPVYDIEKYGDLLFAATEDGLYFINEAEITNIGDFNQWTLVDESFNLPSLYEAVSIEEFNNELFFTDGLSIYKSSQDVISFIEVYEEADNSFDITFLSSGVNELLIGLRAASASRLFLWKEDAITEIPSGCIDRIRYAIQDNQGRLWYADNFRDFRYMTGDMMCKRLNFDSPLTEKASDIAISSEVVAIASGGVTDSYGDLFSRDGIYLLKEDGWENINEGNFQPIKDNDLLNFFRVEFSEDNDFLFLGTFWKGIMRLNLETRDFQMYDEQNSKLQPSIGDGKVRVSDMLMHEGKLWISNYNAARPIVMKDEEDQWHSWTIQGDKRVGDLAIDGQGNKWVVSFGNTNGVFVFNEGQDLSSTSDDSRRLINLNNSVIPTSIIYTVESDRQGDIWVGTAEGAILFESGQDLFNSEYGGVRPTVEVEGIGAFLLETEEVRTIEVDGADRKWFGTRNGIFVQSSTGDEQIARYDINNSPLFDNEIVDLAFDGNSGKMYIVTNKGIQAIRTGTTIGRNTHGPNVYVFPNPVDPSYNGPIAVKGLAEDAEIKITDLNGRLVYEARSLGGQAIWNGEDLSGQRVATGVYLVFSTGNSNFGDPDSFVTKILFID
ncbi:MAG: hypothetical protein HKN68_02195 [Saprospiraceae bacterium]|nr:hypothetical protein [Saprospiraceae bacterium]